MITWEPLPLFPSAFLIGNYVFSHNSLKFIPGYSFSHIPQLRLVSRSQKPLLRPPPRDSSSSNNLLSITKITAIQSHHHCPFSPCWTGIWIWRTKKYKKTKTQKKKYKNATGIWICPTTPLGASRRARFAGGTDKMHYNGNDNDHWWWQCKAVDNNV